MPMTDATAFAAAALLVSVAFAASTGERWLSRRRRHDAAWTVAMVLFAGGAAAFFLAAATGWSPLLFRLFYLLGGVLTVPVLALGTVYLLGGTPRGDRIALAVALLCAFATGVVLTAPLRVPLDPDSLNEGQVVFGPGPRALAAVGSGVGAVVVIAGALWSAWRLLRTGRRGIARAELATTPGSAPAPRRLAGANTLVALGTLVISLKGPFVALTGSDEAGFAVALAVGLGIIFGGFLLAGTTRRHRVPTGGTRPAGVLTRP